MVRERVVRWIGRGAPWASVDEGAEMNVKAQGLINAAKWIEENHGRDVLRTVLHRCSPAVRERYISAIAINWHPMDEFVEFVTVAQNTIGGRPGEVAEEIGAAGARANMKGVLLRVAFYLARPEFLMHRIASLWSQFNDRGEMKLLLFDTRHAHIQVLGVPRPEAVFCSVLTGWVRAVSGAIVMKGSTAKHVECRTRGQARCLWEARWTEVADIASLQRRQAERESREPK
jgi:hypothetical protein